VDFQKCDLVKQEVLFCFVVLICNSRRFGFSEHSWRLSKYIFSIMTKRCCLPPQFIVLYGYLYLIKMCSCFELTWINIKKFVVTEYLHVFNKVKFMCNVETDLQRALLFCDILSLSQKLQTLWRYANLKPFPTFNVGRIWSFSLFCVGVKLTFYRH